jgi:hypothetical protein
MQARPVLRAEDYERFKLDRVIALLRGMPIAQAAMGEPPQ